MRNKNHYQNMFNNNPSASIGFTLAADAVYAAKHGPVTSETHTTDEWKSIARGLKEKYGEQLSSAEMIEAME